MNKLLTLAPFVFLVTAAEARASDVLDDLAAESRKPVERELSVVSFGTRVGLAIPSGKLDPGTSTGQIFGPAMVQDLVLDIRIGSRLILAPYAGYMKGTEGSVLSCDGSSECLVGGLHGGAMLRYTWLRTAATDAWLGYAFSRQWMVANARGFSATLGGFDHHAAAGIDFFVNKRTDRRIGAYVDFAVGRYDEGEVTTLDGTFTVPQHEVHNWTTVGMQAIF